MDKKSLRTAYLSKRRALTTQEVEQKGKQLCQRFFDTINLEHVSCVHCYLPIIDNNEINTQLLIEEFYRRGITVVVPVANFETHEMQIAQLEASTELVLRKGIPEPEHPVFVEVDKIDLVILPLVLFDVKGFRVGYGGGFYDRFLAKLTSDVQLVGLSLFEAVDDIGVDQYDQPMKICLTPEKSYSFI